jgi:hypothetical protein
MYEGRTFLLALLLLSGDAHAQLRVAPQSQGASLGKGRSGFRGLKDYILNTPGLLYNPSIVGYGGNFVVAVRCDRHGTSFVIHSVQQHRLHGMGREARSQCFVFSILSWFTVARPNPYSQSYEDMGYSEVNLNTYLHFAPYVPLLVAAINIIPPFHTGRPIFPASQV